MSYAQFPRNYAPATSSRPGLMSSTDKSKLDGIEANANNYVLPAATTSALGGVMPDGTTITVSSGVLSATDQLNGAKTSTNSGKFLKINAQGEVVAESLTVYNGGVN